MNIKTFLIINGICFIILLIIASVQENTRLLKERDKPKTILKEEKDDYSDWIIYSKYFLTPGLGF